MIYNCHQNNLLFKYLTGLLQCNGVFVSRLLFAVQPARHVQKKPRAKSQEFSVDILSAC